LTAHEGYAHAKTLARYRQGITERHCKKEERAGCLGGPFLTPCSGRNGVRQNARVTTITADVAAPFPRPPGSASLKLKKFPPERRAADG
jgi:hypothetical protein